MSECPIEWWFSSERLTVWVQTTNGTITDAAPVVRRFIGQPATNLEAWMRKQGGFRKAVINTEARR